MAFTTPNERPDVVDESGVHDVASLIRAHAQSLPAPDDAANFGAAFIQFADARVVLLGEATHGTSEFYKARAAITRHLIAHHGFSIVAVEADWPDAARIDRFVRDGAAPQNTSPTSEQPFARFPAWMWKNAEVLDFAKWLQTYNNTLPREARVELRGLDIYSLGGSMDAVLTYLNRVDPAEAAKAKQRYSCLMPWHSDPAAYAEAAGFSGGDSCEGEAVAQLQALLAHRLEYMKGDGEDFFDAAQNARIVHAAEKYYRIMYRGARETWNLRDRHMFDTLNRLLHHRGDKAKAVVWAHNSHIGNAGATSMGWEGEFNIGELARTAFGREAVLIGFGTDRGTVAAASNWGDPVEIKTVRPARKDSYEYLFRRAGVARSLTAWTASHSHDDLREALGQPRRERAIGVIYRPESEYLSHYFTAVLPDQFDAFVWFEESKAVTPLAAATEAGVPDTYPFGV